MPLAKPGLEKLGDYVVANALAVKFWQQYSLAPTHGKRRGIDTHLAGSALPRVEFLPVIE